MKPLSIEELKALEVGDWVWVVDIESPKHGSGYWQVHGFAETHIHLNQGTARWVAPKALYGKGWLAYKNKEQAECMGEIVELIAPLDSELWEIECPKHKDDKGNIWTSLTYKDAKVVKSKYKLSLSNYDMLLKGYYFLTEQEAERRLAELKGE